MKHLNSFVCVAALAACLSSCRSSGNVSGNNAISIGTSVVGENHYKIIVGEEPVEHWDEVLDGWYKAGGEEYVADMQAYIASFE